MELFISGNDPVVFSVNFYTKLYSIDYTFISNAKRYAKFVDIQHGDSIGSKLILTSNVTACDYMPNYVLNYESLLNKESENPDNALVLLLKALIRIGITEVYLAGLMDLPIHLMIIMIAITNFHQLKMKVIMIFCQMIYLK